MLIKCHKDNLQLRDEYSPNAHMRRGRINSRKYQPYLFLGYRTHISSFNIGFQKLANPKIERWDRAPCALTSDIARKLKLTKLWVKTFSSMGENIDFGRFPQDILNSPITSSILGLGGWRTPKMKAEVELFRFSGSPASKNAYWRR